MTWNASVLLHRSEQEASEQAGTVAACECAEMRKLTICGASTLHVATEGSRTKVEIARLLHDHRDH